MAPQNGDNISGRRELKNGRDASTLSEGKFMSPKGKLLDPSKEERKEAALTVETGGGGSGLTAKIDCC